MRKALLIPTVLAMLSLAGAASAADDNRSWRPEMTRLPTSSQFVSVLKRLGVKGETYGWSLLQCHVDETGTLAPCRVILEAPEPGVIGQIALELSAFMRVKPATEDGKAVDGGNIFVPINIGADVNTGPFKAAYDVGSPSFAALPDGDTRPPTIKIPCPTAADAAAVCPARPIRWTVGQSLEENAPIILEAQQASAFSAVSCRYTESDSLEDCQIKGENGPRVTAVIEKLLPTLKAPKWNREGTPIQPARVTIVFNWTMLTKAATAIVAASAELSKAP